MSQHHGPGPSWLRAVTRLILVLTLLPSFSLAESDWEASAYKGWTVNNVKITGLDEDTAGELRSGLALASTRSFLGRKRATFYPETLANDIRRTRLFLARRGYPYVRIVPSFEGHASRQTLVVILSIDKGPPVVVQSARATGVPQDLDKKVRNTLHEATGIVFTDMAVDRATARLDSLLSAEGYARSKVTSKIDWLDSTRVDVHFQVEPGAVCYFSEVRVRGGDDDVRPLARRVAKIRPGSRYSPSTLDDTAENLRLLDLFRQVQVGTEDTTAPDTLDVVIDIAMREFHTIDISARYWSDDGFSFTSRWMGRNTFRRGRGSSILLFASVPEQTLKYSVWWPAVFWARDKAVATVGTSRENEDAYELVDTGVSLTLRNDFSLNTRMWTTLGFSNVQVTNKSVDAPNLGKDQGLLATVGFGGQRDASNDPIIPTRGTLTRFSTEWTPPVKFTDNNYIKGEVTGIAYVPLPFPTCLAMRATVGAAEPTRESTDILPNKRFYSGGSNSMRGFHRRKLGPLDSAGAPLGGEAKFEGSVEYRFPLPWRLAGTLFVDTGQVWATLDEVTTRNIEVAPGFGIWLNTVIGPIRGDLAWRATDHASSEPRWVFHFSVGPAY